MCKINGKYWSYTKASGIVSKRKNSTIKRAIITFTKKLEKSSETMQVEYNVDAKTLIRGFVDPKRPSKDSNYNIDSDPYKAYYKWTYEPY